MGSAVGGAVVTAEPRSRRRLIVTAIVAAAIGAGTGIAAGYQLGDARAPAVSAGKPSILARTPFGSVTAVEAGSVTISGFGRETVIQISDATVVARSVDASVDDIAAGDTIVVSGKTDAQGVVHANEIVVLPKQWLFLFK